MDNFGSSVQLTLDCMRTPEPRDSLIPERSTRELNAGPSCCEATIVEPGLSPILTINVLPFKKTSCGWRKDKQRDVLLPYSWTFTSCGWQDVCSYVITRHSYNGNVKNSHTGALGRTSVIVLHNTRRVWYYLCNLALANQYWANQYDANLVVSSGDMKTCNIAFQ